MSSPSVPVILSHTNHTDISPYSFTEHLHFYTVYIAISFNASLICSWREKEEKLESTSLHSLTTTPSVDEDALPPSDYTHTWELTSSDCSSVNSMGDSNNNNIAIKDNSLEFWDFLWSLLCYTLVSLEANIIGYWILGAFLGIVLTLKTNSCPILHFGALKHVAQLLQNMQQS